MYEYIQYKQRLRCIRSSKKGWFIEVSVTSGQICFFLTFCLFNPSKMDVTPYRYTKDHIPRDHMLSAASIMQ